MKKRRGEKRGRLESRILREIDTGKVQGNLKKLKRDQELKIEEQNFLWLFFFSHLYSCNFHGMFL